MQFDGRRERLGHERFGVWEPVIRGQQKTAQQHEKIKDEIAREEGFRMH
jgi:hypothetical protein